MTHLLPFLWSALKAFFCCFGVAAFFVLTAAFLTRRHPENPERGRRE